MSAAADRGRSARVARRGLCASRRRPERGAWPLPGSRRLPGLPPPAGRPARWCAIAAYPGGLEPGRLEGAARTQLGRGHRLHRRPRRRPSPPRLRLAARLRPSLLGGGRRSAQAADPLHGLRRRERLRAFPDSEARAGRGRQPQRRRPARARRRPLELRALRALPRLLQARGARCALEHRLGSPLGPSLCRAATGLMDIGRRRRPADLPRPAPL
jgi:hypothetical protein